MAICPNCGNQTGEGAVFCDQCGARLPAARGRACPCPSGGAPAPAGGSVICPACGARQRARRGVLRLLRLAAGGAGADRRAGARAGAGLHRGRAGGRTGPGPGGRGGCASAGTCPERSRGDDLPGLWRRGRSPTRPSAPTVAPRWPRRPSRRSRSPRWSRSPKCPTAARARRRGSGAMPAPEPVVEEAACPARRRRRAGSVCAVRPVAQRSKRATPSAAIVARRSKAAPAPAARSRQRRRRPGQRPPGRAWWSPPRAPRSRCRPAPRSSSVARTRSVASIPRWT